MASCSSNLLHLSHTGVNFPTLLRGTKEYLYPLVPVFFNLLFQRKAVVAYNKVPAKEERDRQRGEKDEIKFIDFGFERRQVIYSGKEAEGKTIHRFLEYKVIGGVEFLESQKGVSRLTFWWF